MTVNTDKIGQKDTCNGCKKVKLLVARDPIDSGYYCKECWEEPQRQKHK